MWPQVRAVLQIPACSQGAPCDPHHHLPCRTASSPELALLPVITGWKGLRSHSPEHSKPGMPACGSLPAHRLLLALGKHRMDTLDKKSIM